MDEACTRPILASPRGEATDPMDKGSAPGDQLSGARANVAPHSVVMKRESLLAGHAYAGCPTRPAQEKPAALAGAGD